MTKPGENSQIKMEDLASKLSELEVMVCSMKKQIDKLDGRAKSLLVYNLEEPVIRDTKTRKQADNEKARNIMRMVGMYPATPLLNIHRVGVWRPQGIPRPRPLLIVFETAASRDYLLARTDRVKEVTAGTLQMTPDGVHQRADIRAETKVPPEFRDGLVDVTLHCGVPCVSSTPAERVEVRKSNQTDKEKKMYIRTEQIA